jgi:hypothetical protein
MKKVALLIMLLAVYVSVSELGAKKKADQFCESVQVGGAVNGLLEKAIESGASEKYSMWRKGSHGKIVLDLYFSGYRLKSGFSCQIEEVNGLVSAARGNIMTEVH